MSIKLGKLEIKRKTGDEDFLINGDSAGFKLIHFWRWADSDLVNNRTRAIIAEFIVMQALGIDSDYRVEWDAYDIIYKNRKIEVKSAAYIQSWEQKRFSGIGFDIKPTQGWDAATNEYSKDKKRQSDIYVFCLLSHKNQSTINPLDLNQWEFYILRTSVLDELKTDQKGINLSSLLELYPNKAGFDQIREVIDGIFDE